MADDPYAAFSSPAPQQADPYASFSSPAQQQPVAGGPRLPRNHGESLWEYAKRQWADARAQDAAAPTATLGERAGAAAAGFNRGVAGIVGMPVDALANAANLTLAGLGTAQSKITGTAPWAAFQTGDPASVPFSGEWNAQQLNKLPGAPAQIPRPDDAISRYLYAGGAGASTGLIGPATGAGIIPSTVSGITGAGASQLAAENGAGPGGQALAGVLGGAAPSALRAGFQAGVRGAVRGGEQGRQQMAQNTQDFQNAGTQPSVGMAAGNRRMQATESLLAKTPGSAGVMAKAGEKLATDVGSNIDRLANQLSPKASGEQAGRAIEKGVTGPGGFIENFKAKSSANYDQLDKFVKPDAKVGASNTSATLDALTAPIKGAEKTSGLFSNSKISAIKQAFDEDVAANGGSLPYAALKRLRSMVGEQLADAPFAGDVPSAQWKRLYAGMSADMEAAAKASGPVAQKAFERANQFHKAGMARIDTISSVLNKNGGPEAVFKAATSGAKEGATTLRAVMQSLPPDAQKVVSAGVLRRLGKAKAGVQNDVGDKFSTETFLTNWSAMSPEAKATLFDRYGSGFRADMDAVAKTASNLREGSAVFRNPSGTAPAAGQITAATAFFSALGTGHPGVAAGVATGVGGANVAARLLTNPKAVKWLAMQTRAPASALPAILNQGIRSSDPDIRDAAEIALAEMNK